MNKIFAHFENVFAITMDSARIRISEPYEKNEWKLTFQEFETAPKVIEGLRRKVELIIGEDPTLFIPENQAKMTRTEKALTQSDGRCGSVIGRTLLYVDRPCHTTIVSEGHTRAETAEWHMVWGIFFYFLPKAMDEVRRQMDGERMPKEYEEVRNKFIAEGAI